MNFFTEKKIVIPGGNGFFGSHLVPRLIDLGAEVFVPKQSDGWDFRMQEDCQRLYAHDQFDIAINLAANTGGIGYHSGRQGEMFHDNMLMGLHLLQEACSAKIPKFVNVVAGCSYPGYLEKDELTEEDYWDGPVHESIFSYGFPRKASVLQGLALEKQYNYNSIHLIYANMYGPREHFHPEQSKALAGLLKKFYDAKKSGAATVEVWGSGKPVRDWLYVKDGVEGLLRAAEAYNSVAPLNISSGIGVSVKDLASTIKDIVGFEGDIIFNTDKPDGALKKTFSAKKMQEQLDWLPQTTLEQGIKETQEWLDANYELAVNH
jgi:GDP-L-fucose synthase